MVLYKGYCRPLGKKVDFAVEDVISMNTKRGIKWRVKGKFEAHNISTFCSAEKAQELLSKLPLKMDAEIAYTPPPNTYEAEKEKKRETYRMLMSEPSSMEMMPSLNNMNTFGECGSAVGQQGISYF